MLLLMVLLSCKKDGIDYENSRTAWFKNIREAEYADSSLVCVTFNIQLGFPEGRNPWDNGQTGADAAQVASIVEFLQRVHPDLIALQEVPLNRSNAVLKHFLDTLAVAMNLNYAFGSHGYNDPEGVWPVEGEWGTAVLSRFPIKGIQNVQVEYISKWEKRSLLDAEIELNPGRSVNVISLHYLPSGGVPNTVAHLKTITGPVIVMGDFNITGDIPELTALGFRDADTLTTSFQIDRIFYRAEWFRCTKYGTIADSVPRVSDHPANYCILRRTI